MTGSVPMHADARRSRLRPVPRPLTAALLAAVGVLVASCTARPPPCAGHDACGPGRECLANRCRWRGADPVRLDTVRTVLSPSRMAIVGGPAADLPTALPGSVRLGGRAGTPSRLLLAFELPAVDELDTAWLLLEPLAGALQPAADSELAAWRVTEPWRPGVLAPLAAPALAPPRGTGLARSRVPTTIRVDVTAIVRHWLEHPRAAQGLALAGESTAPLGVTLATGVCGGGGPRLELYATESPRPPRE